MYLRRTQRRRSDGSTVGYLQLAHNRRVDGVTRAEVLVNLGREDELDVEGLKRLAGSIERYTGTDGALEGVAAGFVVTDSRALGGVWLLDGLWKQLGVARALIGVLGPRRFSTDMERVLFALVANRALDPCSKLAAAEWVTHDAPIPGLDAMDEDQAYRAMDLLVEADAQAQVQEAVFFATADLLNLEVDLLFFDTTSTYFERDEPDPAADDTAAFRAYGHSKDHRPDLPQVVIGLAVTREGIPVRVWVWPGNTNDMSVISEVKDDLRGWRLGRVITVVDRGFSSEENLRYLTRAGGHWIAGERMRNASADAQAALARQGRYQQVRDNLRVKEVLVGQGDGAKRFIICHNPAEAERDKTLRDQTITRLQAELERIKTARAKAKSQKASDAHHRAECALRDHPTLGRYLRQTKTGRLLIDRANITAEERLDGKYLLSTSDPDLSAEDVALGYKNLLEAERGFRDMKSTLELRPVFHRLEHRIRAHVLICWLALLLIRVTERQSGQTWRRVALELQRLHLITLTGPDGTVQQTTPPSPLATQILAAVTVTPPPRITAITPA
ncbi:MAG: IS1634 family transposase [Thermoleophilaceae bacterium]|jgi:transposase|nr:IS1634 family transposase [Thermoleophilaceae bacterium]